MLTRPPDQVTLLDIALAVEPISDQPRCFLGMAVCSDEHPCPLHDFWKGIRRQTRERLRADDPRPRRRPPERHRL